MSDYWDFLGFVAQAITTVIVYRRSRRDAEQASKPPPVVLTSVDSFRTGFRPDGVWRAGDSGDEYDDGALRAELERLE
jgi:hypothetical protein